MANSVPRRPEPQGVTLSPQQQRSRRARNVAIGLAIGGLVILFYAITIIKLGPHVFTMFDGT